MKLEQGDIVLVPFPFTDLSSVKTRPALVLSNKLLRGDDVIVCGITSQQSGVNEVELTNASLKKGMLPLKSYVRSGKIASLHAGIVRKVVAKVKDSKLKETIGAVYLMIKAD